MSYSKFCDNLKNKIEDAYLQSGNSKGWRFLSSPANTLKSPRVAFIGLNPGGNHQPASHPQFAMPKGSAYVDECWPGPKGKLCKAGKSPLQKQVRELFCRLHVEPDRVLSGNLVPFRSPNWNKLKKPKDSLKFGKCLWTEVLRSAKPQIVISMGSHANRAVCEILDIKKTKCFPLNWGATCCKVGIVAFRADFNSRECGKGVFIGLPHLSHYSIMLRKKSAPSIKRLLSGL